MSIYFSSPLVRIALLVTGGLGTLVCLLCIGGVWRLEWRLNVVRKNLVTVADNSLEQVDQHLARAGRLVNEATLTAGEVEERLAKWTRDEVTDRVAEQLKLEEGLDQLDQRLKQVDHWLDSGKAATSLAEQALELGQALTLPIDTRATDQFTEHVGELRMKVGLLSQRVETLKNQLAEHEPDDVGSIAQAAKLAAHLAATFGATDERLAGLADLLDGARQSVVTLAVRTRRKLLVVAVLATLLLLWLAAGQVSLLRRGMGK